MASVNLESKISHLYELRDSLKETITNLERVVKEQDSLIKIIGNAEEKYDLSDEMVEKLIDDKQQLEKNLVNFAEAIACTDTLIVAYEKESKENRKHSDMTTDAIVTLVCNAFGLFRDPVEKPEEEPKSEE